MPASPSTARAINDRMALRLLQEQGPLTAGQLKQQTGLSRPTVADLVERLQGAGLIAVVGEAGAERRGPNARLYGIVADRAHLAALDVRTRSVKVAVADLLGAVLAEAVLDVDAGIGTEPAVDQAVELLERTAREAGAGPLHSVAVGAPGLIDPGTGELRDSSGLPAWHRRLVAALHKELPAAVLVENETNLAAVAEQRAGAAQDRDTFVFLWLGHGVGAAVVLDGRLRRGASGGAGEIGFLPVPGTGGLPSATDCADGFHALAGSAAVSALAARHGLPTPTTTGPEPAAAAVVAAAVRAVERAAADAEPEGGAADPGAGTGTGADTDTSAASEAERSAAFLDALADGLAVGAAAVTAVLDPGCVVLGGALGHAGGATLAARVERRLAALSPLATEVRAGRLGGAAVLRGALFAARDAAQDDLFAGDDGAR